MKNYAFALLTMISATSVFAGPGEQDAVARLKDAGLVMHEIMAAPDKGIPEEVLHDAKCIAVIPNMAKGAFLVGGEHGRGVVTCRAGHGWSAPAFLSIGGGNFGFQAGAQSVDLVMLFMNDKGVQGLLSSKFELTGEASAAAGPVGRHASAGTDWKMNTEALSYSRTKGLFAGVAIDGAVVDINLRNDLIFPVVRTLRARKVPLLFTTGYDRKSIEPEFQDIRLWEKPLDIPAMARDLAGMIKGN